MTPGSKIGGGVALALTIILVAGLGLQTVRTAPQAGRSERSGILAAKLPLKVAGWTATEEPLGATESISAKTAEVLNYDDYVYRRYAGPEGREFAVYAAHWARGRMPTRLIVSHTPDRCWIENGWRCVKAKYDEPVTALQLPATQWREFSTPVAADRVFVWFWLTVDGKPYDFGERLNTVPSPWRWIKQAVTEPFQTSGEQLFIRVTSNRPLEELASDRGFSQVMTDVRKLLATTP